MQYKSLNIYREGITPQAESYTFYILRIGMNAGKPLKEPCANCYAFRCNNNESYEFYYWLAYGLWQGRLFAPCRRGSAISFIIKSEFLKVVKEAESKVHGQYEFYMQTIKTVNVYERSKAGYVTLVAKIIIVANCPFTFTWHKNQPPALLENLTLNCSY